MVQQLHYQSVRELPYPPEDVFLAVQSQKIVTTDPNLEGAVLSVQTVSGTPGEVGHVAIMRLNWVSADLEMSETTLSSVPNSAIRVLQRPERLVMFNHRERRLPASVCMLDDLEGGFEDAFGNPPAETEIQFDFTATAQGTDLTITVELYAALKPNWFARRRWLKGIKNDIEQILARVGSALT